MNVAIYKPNAKKTGNAFNFQISTKKDVTLYVNAIQQHSWNDKTKTGSFVQNREDPDKNISFKLNEFELGEMLSAFNGRYSWNASTLLTIIKLSLSLPHGTKSVQSKLKTETTLLWFRLLVFR